MREVFHGEESWQAGQEHDFVPGCTCTSMHYKGFKLTII